MGGPTNNFRGRGENTRKNSSEHKITTVSSLQFYGSDAEVAHKDLILLLLNAKWVCVAHVYNLTGQFLKILCQIYRQTYKVIGTNEPKKHVAN